MSHHASVASHVGLHLGKQHSINEVIAYECCVVVGESVIMMALPEHLTHLTLIKM